MPVTISHKKMTEIKQEISKVIDDKDKQEQFTKFLSNILNYNEDKVYYNNERYEKYIKPYREKNKDAINKKRAETYKKNKEKQTSNIEEQFNKISI